jgi:hypothetical protein
MAMAGTNPAGAKIKRENPLPPCGGGLGWGVAPAYPYLGEGLNSESFVQPPTPTLPHKGGGGLRPL